MIQKGNADSKYATSRCFDLAIEHPEKTKVIQQIYRQTYNTLSWKGKLNKRWGCSSSMFNDQQINTDSQHATTSVFLT